MARDMEEHPLALGLHNTAEQQKPIELEVEGKIPDWISGSLYRGAPSIFDVGTYRTEHFFEGFTRLYRFAISDGKVEARSRNATDEMIEFVKETGRYPGPAFANDPCKMMFGALETKFDDNLSPGKKAQTRNVGVDFLGNFPGVFQRRPNDSPLKTLVATTDSNELVSLDPESLEPLETWSYEKYNAALDTAGLSAAHPHHGADGSLYNFVLTHGENGPEYRIFELNPEGRARILTTITDAPASYIHAVFGTEHYVVFVVWQCFLELEDVMTKGSLMAAMKPFDDTAPAMFYVIDKKTGDLTGKYTTEAFFSFHEIACFEDPTNDSIVIDLPWMQNWDFLEAARMKNLRAKIGKGIDPGIDIPGRFRRYRLPRATIPVSSTTIREAILDFDLDYTTCNIELPQINKKYHMKPYRYAYGIHISKPGFFADSLVKIDTISRSSKIWKPENQSVPSEPLFIPIPNAIAEDDGVLVSVIMDSVEERSYVAFIDARDMEMIARAKVRFVVNYGFHGTYASD